MRKSLFKRLTPKIFGVALALLGSALPAAAQSDFTTWIWPTQKYGLNMVGDAAFAQYGIRPNTINPPSKPYPTELIIPDSFEITSGLPSGFESYYREYTVNEIISYAFCAEQMLGAESVTARTDDEKELIGALTSVHIPDAVRSIGSYAFYKMSGLQTVNIPTSLTDLGTSAFEQCTSIESVTLPESTQYIGDFCFYGCTSLRDVKILGSLSRKDDAHTWPNAIAPNAFQNCTSLESVTIGQGITGIKSLSFNGCNKLREIVILGTDPITLESNSFQGVNMSNVIVKVPNGSEDNFSAFANLGAHVVSDAVDFTQPFPENGAIQYVFLNETSTATWNIAVKRIKAAAGTDVVIPAGFNYGGYECNVVGVVDAACQRNSVVTSVHLPEGITAIGANAFMECLNLTSVNIPSTVTEIGDCAFSVNKLSELTIPSSVQKIGNALFDQNSTAAYPSPLTLQNVTLNTGEGVTILPTGTFRGCSNLQSVTLSPYINSIATIAFSGCSNLTSLNLKAPLRTIASDAFSGVNLENLTVTVPDGANLSDYQALANLGVAAIETESGNQLYPAPAFNPENAPAFPSEAGWYRIKFIELGNAYTSNALCTALLGKYVVNLEDEHQLNSDDYSFGLADLESSKEAATFVWMEPSGTQYKAKSINGHYSNHQAIAKRDGGSSFILTLLNEELKGVAFGQGWMPFGSVDNAFWGLASQSTAANRNRYRITPVDVSGYDIYSVEIANASDGNRVKNDAKVTCSNEANLGVASVYNRGNFFFPKGTTVTAADFTGTENNGITPRITVDAENKTIHAEYSLEGLYNHYLNTLNLTMTATGLLAENETVDYPAFNASLTLDQNKTAAYDKAYDTAKSKLNGHKVYLRVATASGNAEHDYLTVKEDGTVPQHKLDWTPLGAWTISFKTGNKVTLYNEVAKKYISNTAPATAGDRNDFSMSETAFELSMFLNAEEATTHHGYFSFNTNGATTNTQVYMHAKSRPTIGKWGNAGDGSWWKFYLIDNEMEQGWINELEAQISPAATPLGTNPGEWQVAEHPELHELQANWKEMTTEENLDYAKLYALTNAVASIPAEMTWTQNPVEAGHYYRIRTSKLHASGTRGLDAYFSNQEYSSSLGFIPASNISDTNYMNTLFFTAPTAEENKFYLICHGDGKYVHATTTNGSPFLRMSTLSEVSSIETAPNYAIKAYFNPVGADEATSMIFYYTTPSATRAVHAWTMNNNTTMLKSDMCGSSIETNANKVYHYYTIEQINELPVAIAANGYGSVVAPVALNLPVVDGYSFYAFEYVVNGQDKNFQLREVEVPATIAANTPILVKGYASGSINLGINYDYTDAASVRAREAEAEDQQLIVAHASHIASAHAATEAYNTYALSATEVGLSDGDVVFTPINDGEELVAGTMHLTMPANINDYINQEIVKGGNAVLNLNSSYTTGIREVESADQQGADVIYDLQGRRLNAPIRGLNIINGRKVMVK